MKNALLTALLFASVATRMPGATEPAVEPAFGPVLHGTINVVIANGGGIVVLTDSMLTETRQDAHGQKTSRQLPQPGQKLFRIDDHSVCAFAGFASANTGPLPDFLNSVSAIMGRFQDRLRETPPLSISDKLELLEGLFKYYLTGIANIRSVTAGTNYSFELILAGFDLDGTAKIGRLVLGTTPESVNSGEVLWPVEQYLRVFPVASQQILLVNGKTNVARQILRNPERWNKDTAIDAYERARRQNEAMTIEQMKAFAISLKRQTAKRDREVGGPIQVAVSQGWQGRILRAATVSTHRTGRF